MSVIDDFKLNGKIALVTGGAGMYGQQIVSGLAEAGATTFIASRNIDSLRELAKSYKDAGLDVRALRYDQGDEESVCKLINSIIDEAGKIDIFVSNAVVRPMKDWNSPLEQFKESMNINACGMFMILREVGNRMAKQRYGSIINVGSIQGMIGPDFSLYEGLDMTIPPDYFFHKGGMIQITKYAAGYLGKYGVRVNCISPGGFFSNQPELFLERYNKNTYLGRMADETDIKGVIVFLASDSAKYITGANIPVDGGYTAM